MSTNTLHAAVNTASVTATVTVATMLDRLATHGAMHLAAAESVAARLAAEDHQPEDADRDRARRALDVALTAHNLITLVKSLVYALADDTHPAALDDALTGAVAAAEPAVVAAVRQTLLDAATADSAPLIHAIIAELRLAENAAATMGAAPDTIPEGW